MDKDFEGRENCLKIRVVRGIGGSRYEFPTIKIYTGGYKCPICETTYHFKYLDSYNERPVSTEEMDKEEFSKLGFHCSKCGVVSGPTAVDALNYEQIRQDSKWKK